MISKSEVGSWIKAYESRESATSMPLDDTYMSSQVSSVLQTSLTQEVGNLYEYQGHRTTKLGSLVLSFVNIETEEEVVNTVEAGTYGRPSVYSEDYTEYTHSEILELLSTEQWTVEIEE